MAWPVRALCDLFDVHPSGYYAWLNKPRSKRIVADERLTGLIKQFWLESVGVYGYRKIFSDLREHGEHLRGEQSLPSDAYGRAANTVGLPAATSPKWIASCRCSKSIAATV